MGAEIIPLAKFRAARAVLANAPSLVDAPLDLAERFHFWLGASGRRYVHTVYSLVECPAIPAGNYVLVHRDEDGRRQVLAIGRVGHQAASLNLADIRRRGAELGANEVHVHLLAASAKQSRMVETDLRSAQYGREAVNELAG
ncbi:MAG: hypothetical protein NW216_01715 [Hyphomicrobium sp.]|nr:hypothetical protein [Hyphomicrobium sp.]